MAYYENRAELYLGDDISPDFYGWIFPKGDHVAVGPAAAPNTRTNRIRILEGVKARAGDKLRGGRRILLEGHPLPMSAQQEARLRTRAARRRRRRDGRAHLGRGHLLLDGGGPDGRARDLQLLRLRREAHTYEKAWQKKYGAMFDFLEFLEKIAYLSNGKREWFTDMCRVKTVQRLTFDSYLFKDMATVKPHRSPESRV